jgi:hypothetical protein
MSTNTATFVPVVPRGASTASLPGLGVTSLPFVSVVPPSPSAVFLVNTTVPTPAAHFSSTGGNEFDAPDVAPAGDGSDASPGENQQPATADNQTGAALRTPGWFLFRAGDPLAASHRAAAEQSAVIEPSVEWSPQRPLPSLAAAAGMLLFLAGGWNTSIGHAIRNRRHLLPEG